MIHVTTVRADGVEVGDRIIAVRDEWIVSHDDVPSLISALRSGDGRGVPRVILVLPLEEGKVDLVSNGAPRLRLDDGDLVTVARRYR